MMTVGIRTTTTEMEVTSIRFERVLKEKLKELAGDRGYQSLIREILWDYVQQHAAEYRPSVLIEDIQSTIPAQAQKRDICYLTGAEIVPQESIMLGLTKMGKLVPLKVGSLR